MISAIELINALSGLIRENFPDIKIEDRDIEEGFDRPSFFIDVPEITTGKTGEMYSDTHEVKIYYFASNRKIGYIECLKVKNQLRYLLAENFKLPSNEEFVFAFEDVNYYINKRDKTLLLEGAVLFVQEEDRSDNTPEIEELNFNLSFGSQAIPIEQGETDDTDQSEIEDFVQKIGR